MRPIVHGPAARSALAGAVLGFVLVTLVAREEHVSKSKVPPTRREPIVEVIHGERVADPYRWLEDVTSPEVKAWMKAQDGYTRDFLGELPGRAALVDRLRELFYYDALGAPTHRRGRHFWTRKHADREKNIVYWREGAGEAKVLFDPNGWSEDGSVGLGGWWPSWDGAYVAYNIKANNADESVMHVVEVATGRVLPDVIEGTKYAGASWLPDGSGFFYTWVPPIGGDVTVPNRPGFAELRFHAIGTDPATDAIVRGATGDPQTFLGGFVSQDGRWLVAVVQHGWNSSDIYVRDRLGGGDWRTLIEGVEANVSVDVWKDRFYVTTDLDAPRYRVLVVDPAELAREKWREIVPEDRESTIAGVDIVGGHLVVNRLRKAQSELEVRTLDGAFVRTIALPATGTTSGMSGLPDEDTGYFSFTSFTEPGAIYRVSIADGTVEEWSRVELPIDTSPYVTRQVTYTSKDGTPVTMFLIHHRDVTPDGARPTILYGYGGFNVPLTPAFSSARMVWLERGGVYAIANLRGGGEYGEDWHRDGMLDRKQNVFDDFLAAARWLIDQRWTSPRHLAIQGGSNGGLLVGAAMTQAPELFRAVVCAVPLLDMVRFHKFGSGATWIPEYGDPEIAEQFRVLYAYSPYHRVREGVAYPALLMLSADSDDRVDPMHARKLTAAVQHATSSDAPVLLRIEENAGHGGADLVKQAIEQAADTYLFLEERLR
jgi:prolyl oligopeptidase